MGDPKAVEVRKGLGGETAFLTGTRTRVSDVARLFLIERDEMVIERICKALPHLQPDQVRAALDWWRSNEEQVQAEIDLEQALLAKMTTG